MKAPAWMRLRPAPVQATPGVVTITITVDTSGLARAARDATEAMRTMGTAMAGAGAAASRFIERERSARLVALGLRLEAVHAGAAAAWYVKGAMAPEYADPVNRDAQVRFLATSGVYGWADLAVSFLRGWVEHRDTLEDDLCRFSCAYGDDVGVPTSPTCGVHDGYAAHLLGLGRVWTMWPNAARWDGPRYRWDDDLLVDL